MSTWNSSHTHTLNTSGSVTYSGWEAIPLGQYLTKSQFALTNPIKEPEMSMADKVAKERKERKERARVEAAWEQLEQVVSDDADDGTVLRWHHGETWGASIFSDGQWGGMYSADELIARLVARDVVASDLEVWDP